MSSKNGQRKVDVLTPEDLRADSVKSSLEEYPSRLVRLITFLVGVTPRLHKSHSALRKGSGTPVLIRYQKFNCISHVM